MAQVKHDDFVSLHYTCKLPDGTVFDTTTDRGPLEFLIGEGRVMPDFEQAVIGMSPGETKTITIPATRAYGRRFEELVKAVERSKLPVDPEILKVGQSLQLKQGNGTKVMVTVTDVSETSVTIDANHPLAGKDLTYDIQLLECLQLFSPPEKNI